MSDGNPFLYTSTIMIKENFIRTAMLIGEGAVEKLNNSSVCVFGVGGVGGYCVEALARAGVGKITVVDNDSVAVSNINRQIIATFSSVGNIKVEEIKKRLLDINPEISVTALPDFFCAENADKYDFSSFDYVVDAIDTVSAKLLLAEKCNEAGVKLISAMGAGNKLDPTAFKVADISKTSVCPLAKVMRRELKKRGIYHLKTVYSEEQPATPIAGLNLEKDSVRRQTPSSISFVPPVVGMIIASEVIKDLIRL